jgi:hypothetical protein
MGGYGSSAGLRDPDLDAVDLPVEAGPPDSGRPGRPGPGQERSTANDRFLESHKLHSD